MPAVRRTAAAPGVPDGRSGERPADDRLVDRFGRVATDLRVTLTDRCNLRCTYCMPAEGLDWLPDERAAHRRRARPARSASRVEQPRRRRDPVHRRRAAAAPRPGRDRRGRDELRSPRPRIVAHHQRPRPRPARRALADAGLDRINVSLDTLDRERFAQLTHRDRLPDVLAGLRAAADAGLTPVKINTVLLRGVNDDEAVPLLGSPSSTATSCGSSSRCRSTPSMRGSARDDHRRRRSSSALSAGSTLTPGPGRARGGAGGDAGWSDGGRGDRPGRRDRVGDPAVLRRLRPHPAHRRRPGAQLPVRPRGDRPARPAARRRRTTRSPTRWRDGDVGASAPVTASTTRLPAAGSSDVRDRRLSDAWSPCATSPGLARPPASTEERSRCPRRDRRRRSPAYRRRHGDRARAGAHRELVPRRRGPRRPRPPRRRSPALVDVLPPFAGG